MNTSFQPVLFILYVSNVSMSSRFYERMLQRKPELEVPGMTEFRLHDSCMLGLMPEEGISRVLGDSIVHPSAGQGIPRCEIYLYVEDMQAAFNNAIQAGARLLSPIQERDWGDTACYFADPDGHVVALAIKRIRI